MNSLCFCITSKNKVLFLIFLVLVGLLSVYMPYNILEQDDYDKDYRSLYKYFINRPATSFNKLWNQSRTFLHKIFKSTLIGLKTVILVTIYVFLLNKSFFNKTILYLFYLICFYFNGGKFKDNLRQPVNFLVA